MAEFVIPIVPTCDPELGSLREIAQRISFVQLMFFDAKSLNGNFVLAEKAVAVLSDWYRGLLLHLPFRDVFLTPGGAGVALEILGRLQALYPQWQLVTLHPSPDVDPAIAKALFTGKSRERYIQEDIIPTIRTMQKCNIPIVVENGCLWNAHGQWSLVGALPSDLAEICNATGAKVCLDICHALIVQEQCKNLFSSPDSIPRWLRSKVSELAKLRDQGLEAYAELPIAHVHLAGYACERGPYDGHGAVPKGQQLAEIRSFLRALLLRYSIPYILLEVREDNYRERVNLLAMLDLFGDLV